MGQKANPIGNRLGIIRGWESNWFGGKEFAAKLVGDEKIRNYLRARISKGGISQIVIERTLNRITIPCTHHVRASSSEKAAVKWIVLKRS